MKIKTLLLLLAIVLSVPGWSQSPWQTEIDSISSWIARRLFIQSTSFPNSDGAIVLTPPGPGSCNYQGSYYQVVIPTFATGSAQALLLSTRSDKADLTRRFMNWFAQHYTAYALPLPTKDSCHWFYKVGGNPDITGAQVHCAWGADPAYGDAALPQFCQLAWQYFQTTHDSTWFQQPTIKTYLETNMDYIIDSLLQPDGLTWGDGGYPFKLCMDNSSGFAGFEAMGLIEHHVYHDHAQATRYLSVASRIRRAVKTLHLHTPATLQHTPDSTYRWYTGGPGFDTTLIQAQWYPRVTSTIAPQVNGVDNPCGALSRRQRNLIRHFFDGTPYPDWTNTATHSVYTDLAYASAYGGDTALAQAHLNNIKTWYYYGFPFPYTGADTYLSAFAYKILMQRPDCNDGDLTRTYCASSGNPASDNAILHLALADIRQTTGFTAGQFNYQEECFDLPRDSTLQMLLYPIRANLAQQRPVVWQVWVDANQNGQFDVSELVVTQTGNNVDPVQTNFHLPSTSALGYTAMRVSMKADVASSPCETGFDGDVEDYCLKVRMGVVSAENAMPTAILRILPNPATSTIHLSGFNGPGEQMPYRICDPTGREVATGTFMGDPISIHQLPAGIYFIHVRTLDHWRSGKFLKVE